MFNKSIVSLMMLSGLIYSFDLDRDLSKAVLQSVQADGSTNQSISTGLATDLVEKTVNTARSGFDKVRDLVVDGLDKARAIVARPLPSEPLISEKMEEEALEALKTPLENAAVVTPVRFAAVREYVRNCWNSPVVQFPCNMFNPYAHGRAWRDMWRAGFTGALPELWANHKAVIAGAVVITTAAATGLYYAHKKGLLAKTKVWALALQEECQRLFA